MHRTEAEHILSGPAGNLEILADFSPSKPIIAVICHPHPLHGGTMNNKVVSTLVRAFHDLDVKTVRFNFRGVGKSAGKFGEGIGEVEDLLAVVAWVKKQYPDHRLWLGGFSFGGFIAAKVATQIPVAGLVTIAPQASRFTAEPFPPITVPWILVQGDADEIVSPAEVYAWIETLENKPAVITMPGAGHFFHGRLLELREILVKTLQNKVFRRVD